MSHTRLYRIWKGFKARCVKGRDFSRYGGRGITVCPEWRDSFEAFREWAMANGYRDDLTLDRIDNYGNYCPENCRWATAKEQANNRRNNRILTAHGKTQSLQQWAEEYGINKQTLLSRLNRGQELNDALRGD